MKGEKIKNYCIVGMDNVNDLDKDIKSISEDTPKLIVGGKKVGLIGIFKSKLDVDEIKKTLNVGNNRTFFISELNPSTFSAHIDVPDIHEIFFGEFDERQKTFNILTNDIKCFISGNTSNNKKTSKNNSLNTVEIISDEKMLSSLSETKRSEMMDELLTNVNNLSDKEKKVLNFLASL